MSAQKLPTTSVLALIKATREVAKKSQTDLAVRYGMTQSQYSRLENGLLSRGPDRLDQLAREIATDLLDELREMVSP